VKKPRPVTFSITDVMTNPKLLGPYFSGPSWATWRSVLKAAFVEPMTDEEVATFREVAGGRSPPQQRVSELVNIVGRGGGKDSIASLLATTVAINFNSKGRLRPGELATIICIACDRDQAKIVFDYVKGYFEEVPALASMVKSIEKSSIVLDNRVEIMVETNSYRSVRGRSFLCAIFDEVAFWRTEGSAVPDTEVANAVGPGLLRIAGSMSILISTAHRRTGLLYDRFQNFYGKDNDDTLVVLGTAQQFNPTLDAAKIAAKIAEDPQEANAEYNSIWRDDLAGFIDRKVIEAAVDRGVAVRPPQTDIRYYAFVDNSGGRSDSFVLAIAHYEHERGIVVLDLVKEWRPPQFTNPSVVVAEMAQIAKSYRCYYVTGDAYAAEWAVERFREVKLNYVKSDLNRSGFYLASLPKFSSGQVRLVDHERLVQQFSALERRTMPGGHDNVDHPKGGHDDLSNAVAGVLVIAGREPATYNTGGGMALYSAYADRINEGPESSGTPDTIDHSKPYKGYFHERYTDLRQQWRGGGSGSGSDEKLISELRALRATTGDLDYHRTINEFIGEIQRGRT
jgi:hypothetical protein